MEIEAKFAVPNAETFDRLQAIERLADLTLSPGQPQQVHDTYLDTPEGLILKAGYACRWREHGEGVLISLKGLGKAQGAIHRRQELQALLPRNTSRPRLAPPSALDWPAGPLRERIQALIGDKPLLPLFSLQQERLIRQISQEERQVAELSLDEVHLDASDQKLVYFELEAELTAQGSEEDLAHIIAHLQDRWNLSPEPQSKFERALAYLLNSTLLTPPEQTLCRHITSRTDLYGRRAAALLALNQGATQVDASKRAGVSDRTVRNWLSAFRQKRLNIFPRRVLEPAQAELAAQLKSERQRAADNLLHPLPLKSLLDRYNVDQTQAQATAGYALTLFDQLRSIHRLPPERRSLLETAALVYSIGQRSAPKRPHTAGRDILLTRPPAELDASDGRIVALTTWLHHKAITAKKLDQLAQQAPWTDLSKSLQSEASALAALLRMAIGLNHSQTGSSQLRQFRQQKGSIQVEVEGPYARLDAGQAQAKSDLWRLLFETDVQFKAIETAPLKSISQIQQLAKPADDSPLPPLLAQPGLELDDSMVEVARKTLYFHFERMLYHEPGTRLGVDIEELHDMRVATRRMRTAFRIFGDYLIQVNPFIKGLQRTGRALGAVRDLDVFWEKTQYYLDTLPPDQSVDLGPLRTAWEAQRERARERMLTYLDSERYIRFKERFGQFLQTPGAGARPTLSQGGDPLPHRLRHVAPVLIYRRLAAVQAFDEWITGPDIHLDHLHRLRIAAKRLRYTVEYLREVLKPGAQNLIEEIKTLQNHLGDLQDAVVARDLLRDFLTWGTWGRAASHQTLVPTPEPITAPGVSAYLNARQTELEHLVKTFPQLWTRFQSSEFSQWVASVVAGL